MDLTANFGLPVLLLVLTLAFGLWVSQAGKPYNGLLFNIHKLIALGAVIYFSMRFFPALKVASQVVLLSVLLAAAGLCVLALFVSGALMSAGKLDYQRMLFTHRAALAPLVICIASAVYLLM